MSVKLDDLKTHLGQGARANKYSITIDRAGFTDGALVEALCKGAPIPGKTIGTIPVWNQGRKLLIAGDTSYSNSWTVTFYNDENHTIREAILTWMNEIDDFVDNKHALEPTNYMATATVSQLAEGGDKTTISWELLNLYPTDVSEVALADETADTITEFTVTFTFSHHDLVS